MKRLGVASVLVCSFMALTAAPASAAGGGGASICSLSMKPDGVIVEGDLSTYANAGEYVTSWAPLPGIPGSGWGVQFVCNPHYFVP